MKILRLSISNFRGCKALELCPNGADIDIYGDNATGKTTIADAYHWLLFGTDSLGRAKFAIKPIDPVTTEEIHQIETSVEMVVLHEGHRLTLKKVFAEVWTTKRGAAVAEFDTHTTKHWINGVPIATEREYRAKINSICDEKQWRILSDPTYFHTGIKSWEERRNVLLDLVGNVPDAEVIASSPDLQDLASILEGNSPADHLKRVSANLKTIKTNKETLPVRVDELLRTRPVLEGKANPELLEQMRVQLRELQRQRAEAASGQAVLDLVNQVRLKELEIQTRAVTLRTSIDTTARDEATKAKSEALQRLTAVQRQIDAQRMEIQNVDREIDRLTQDKSTLRYAFDNLTNDLADLAAKPLPEVSTTCPSCGQSLPESEVESARNAYNLKRSKDLEVLGEKRRQAVSGAKEINQKLEALASQKAVLEQELTNLSASEESVKAQVQAVVIPTIQVVDPASDAEYQRLSTEKEDLQVQVLAMDRDVAAALEPIEARIEQMESDIQKANLLVLQHEQVESIDARVAELRSQITELGAKYEELSRQQWLCEEFARAKGRLLETRLNARFRTVRWKLYNPQMNGGMEPTCTAMVDGVEYSALNQGMRVNAGLDIIAALSTQAGFAPPIVIDNAESVTAINPTPGQQIRLIVSATDKSLRFEQATPELQGALL